MKGTKIGLALAVACAIASAPALADRGRSRDNDNDNDNSRVFDICVDGTTGAKLTNFPPAAGDRVTAVGMILPANTVPSDGSGDATCAAYQNLKMGTFFVNGTFVSGFAPDGIKLPEAADDDLGYVDWHFRIDHRAAFRPDLRPVEGIAQ